MTNALNIGKAAEAAGVSTKMIRHYEQIGLLPAASRTETGYRQYSERDISILRFIRRSRQLGFSIRQIADLLGLWSNPGRRSREVKALAQRHLSDLERRMNEMAAIRAALERLVGACHGGEDPDCPILADLSVDGPTAPAPGRVDAGRLRKPARKRPASRPSNERAADSAPADLMAWAFNLGRQHSGR